MKHKACRLMAAGVALIAVVSAATPSARRIPRGKKVTIDPSETEKINEALRLLYARGQYRDVVKCAYVALWKDIKQPEALRLLVLSLRQPKDREAAAAFTHILLRVLDDPKFQARPDTAQRKGWCQARLKSLDVEFRRRQQEYLAGAADRKFTSPQKAEDLWMTQVRAPLIGLHGLYAWKLVGGRKDARKDWIHNTQGRMHRSGAKYMDNVHGRKGVLFTIPAKKSRRLSRMTVSNHGKGKFLRVGARAYGFPFLLNVVIEGQQVFSKTIDKKDWEDLKIPLGAAAAKQTDFVLELVVPEKQRWSEGVFFDYIDFFQD